MKRPWLIPFALALLAAASAARADDDRRGPPAPALPLYTQECAACHTAYPPGLLPASSWQRLMATLPRHFGTDASLDPAASQQIGTWLAQHAGTSKRVQREPAPPPEDRITRSRWFQRKHDDVPASTWQRAAIQSPSNCSACHAGAAQGNFNEHDIRIPR
jgi:hypothetical protein